MVLWDYQKVKRSFRDLKGSAFFGKKVFTKYKNNSSLELKSIVKKHVKSIDLRPQRKKKHAGRVLLSGDRMVYCSSHNSLGSL